MSGQLLLINPKKRTRKAAPKAKAKRRRAKPALMSNPVKRRRRRLGAIRTKAKRAMRKYKRNPSLRLSMTTVTNMGKTAVIGAVGAIAVDALFGQVKGFLPASMQTATDAGGGLNPLYFLAKGSLAVLGGVFGAKLTKHAGTMAEGSLTVSAYEVMRSFVPASVNLGYANPAQLAQRGAPRPASIGKFMSGVGAGSYSPPVDRKYMGEFVS